MGISERRLQEREELRRKILQAAMALYVEEGSENVTVRKIAEKIEYSPATIYLYFKDKNALFYALQEEGFKLFMQSETQFMHERDPFRRLYLYGAEYVRFGLRCPEYYDLMFISRAPMWHLAAEGLEWSHGSRAFNLLRDTVCACLQQRLLPEQDPDVLTLYFWSLAHGLVSLANRRRLNFLEEAPLLPKLLEVLNVSVQALERGRPY